MKTRTIAGIAPDAARSWARRAFRHRRLVAAAALVALYAAAGFLLAPAVLRPVLERRAAVLLGREVSLARLRINPFALSVSAEGLAVTDRDGAPLLRWERLLVNFDAVRSALRREWVFREIRLVGGAARLAMAPDGSLNIGDLITALEATAAPGKPSGPPPVLTVRRLRVEDSTVSFVDRSTGETFTTTLGPLHVSLRDFTTRSDERNAYTFQGRTEMEETFSWRGQFAFDPLRSEGEFTFEGVALNKYHPYYRGTVPFDIRAGNADLRAGYRVAWGAAEREVRLVDASLRLRDLRLSEHQKEEIAVDAPAAEVEDGDIDLLRGAASIGRVATRGGRIVLRQGADGRINLIDMLLPFLAGTPAETGGSGGGAPPGAAPQPATPAPVGPAPTVSLGEVTFADYTVEAEDLTPPRPVRVRLDRINLTLRGVDNVPGTTARGTLDLRWNGEGTVHAEGDLSLVALVADLAVRLDGVDVTPLDPYVEPALDLRVSRGAFFADGRVRANLIDPEHLEFDFAGDARLDDFAAVDGARREDFLRWRSVRMTRAEYSLRRDRLRVGDLDIRGAVGTLARAADGGVNLLSVLRLGPAKEIAGEATPPTGGDPGGGPATPAPVVSAPAPGPDEGDMRIGRVRIRDGRIRLVDRAVTPPVDFALTRIEGTLAGLSSRPGARADVRLSAHFDDTAPVTLEGLLDPLGADVFTDLALLARGVDLGPLGPYSGQYLGYALDRARLSLDMRYHLEDRALQGSNLFTADPFILGEKTDSPDATNLPVRLGLALLRDRHGVIRLDVPVEGSLDDPEFRLGRVIVRALVNVFTKLVTSPFTLLARAFSGKDVDLSVIDFAPGDTVLTEDARSRLDTLSQALGDRPDLTLTIAGGADAAADPPVLRKTRLEGLVRAEKWRSLRRRERETVLPENVVVAEGEYPKYLKAAWRTFREGRPEAKDEPKPETPGEMEDWILARIDIAPSELSGLAAGRSRAVRDHLAAAGVEMERLFLKDGAAADAARVTLELQ